MTSWPMNSTEDITQEVIHPDMTSSKTGNFYFAYGSNLSPSQMRLRLSANPTSSTPVAIARLDAHAWIICQRGYANIVALPEVNAAVDRNTVWGVLYNLDPEDEARLDLFEGHNSSRNPHPEINPNVEEQVVKPYLQGSWDYNKHYLPMTVTKWLRDPNEYSVNVPDWSSNQEQSVSHPTSVRALVYVDELRTKPGKINQEYIGRMNRAIRQSIELGLPQGWINSVMRQFIPEGIEVDHENYVGTDQGYVEAEATETAEQVKHRVLREARTKQQ